MTWPAAMLLAAQLMSGLALLAAATACYAAYALARSLAAAPPSGRIKLKPHLVIPATGPLPELEKLRDALAAQSVSIAAVTFSIESTSDPALGRVAAVFRAFEPTVTTIVAGLATEGSQKSRNLAEALRHLPGDSVVVLADADIIPQRDWLASLLRPIQKGQADIVTGYRWPVPMDARLPTLLASWIDRALASLPKPVGSHLVWGGSVAMAAGLCQRIDLAAHMEREISDDLLLAELARSHGLRVRFQNGVLLATPTRQDWRSLAGFGRRQYQMVRLYAPKLWLASLLTSLVNLLGTVAPLFLASHAWAAIAYGGIVALAMLAGRLRIRLGEASGIPRRHDQAERSMYLLPLFLPLIHLVNLALVLSAASTRSIRWGRYRYRMSGRRVTAIRALAPWPASLP